MLGTTSILINRIVKLVKLQKRPNLPTNIFFEVTRQCNMKCKHCEGGHSYTKANDELSLIDLKELSDTIGPLEVLAIGGGEPFLRDDLPQICQIFATNGLKNLTVHTNGFNVEQIRSAIYCILKGCPDLKLNIGISLDGFETTHDFIRCKGSFSNALRTAHELLKIKSEHENLYFYFNATINNMNHKELPKLAIFINERYKTKLECNILSGTPQSSAIFLPSSYDVERCLSGVYKINSPSSTYGIFLNLYRKVRSDTKLKKRQIVPCIAGHLVCIIHSNGDIRGCECHPPIGNIRFTQFKTVWNGVEARRQHKFIRSGGCFCDETNILRPSLNNYWLLPLLILKQMFFSKNTIQKWYQ
jgi:MoaA/NifB/PqqE/SkfB family radical SAM enzyme